MNCTFDSNEAHKGGVVYATQESEIILDKCTMKNNKATKNGGVVHVSDSAFFTVNNSTFRRNKAR